MPDNPKTPSDAAKQKARASLDNFYGSFPPGWSGKMQPDMREDVPWMPQEANPDLARFKLNISQQAHPDWRPRVAEMAEGDYYAKMGKGLGYEPSFFEDPKRVAGIYQAWKSAPEGATAPDWLDMDALGQAYEYYKFRNEDKPWTEWQFLPEDDPGRGFMQSMGTPPREFLKPDEAEMYANPALVQQGQLAWRDLAPDVRQEILSDPAFYENGMEAYPIQARHEILQDHNFDWDQLPNWQEFVYSVTSNPKIMASPMALAGAQAGKVLGPWGMAGGAVLGYGLGVVGGEEYDPTKGVFEQPSAAASAMRVLNFLSEGTEQGVGFISQAVDDPSILSSDEKRKAAWEISRMTYGASAFADWAENILPALTGDALIYEKPEGKNYLEQVWNAATDRNLFEILMPAHAMIAKMIFERSDDVKYAERGEGFILGQNDPADKIASFERLTGRRVTSSSEFLSAAREWYMEQPDPDIAAQQLLMWESETVGGMIADMGIQSLADPLNVLPEVGTQLAGKVADVRGKTVAAQAAQMGRTPRSSIEAYRSMIQKGMVPDDFDYAAMSSVAQRLGGITIEEAGNPVIRSGKYSKQGLLEVPQKNVREHWSSLDPGSRLLEGHHLAQNHLMQVMTQFDDLHDFQKYMRAVANSDLEIARDLAGNLAGSPEWYTVLPALKAFDGVDQIVNAWDASEVSRNLLYDLADALGEEPRAVLEELGREGGVERTLARLEQKQPPLSATQTSPPNTAGADIQGGRAHLGGRARPPVASDIPPNTADGGYLGGISVERLEGIRDLFTGDQPVPWHPDLAKATISNSLQKHFADWGVKHFGLKQDAIAFRLADTAKKFQGMLMLGGSPSYPINNQLGNMTMRAVTGNFGYLTPKAIDGFFRDFGYTPHDSGVGVGAMGDPNLAKAGSVTIGEVRIPEQGNLGQAIVDVRGSTGYWKKLNNLLSSANRVMPFGALSRMFEGLERTNALAISMKKMWPRIWERGKGFREMPTGLVQRLEGLHPGASELIYRGIESGMNARQIEQAIYKQAAGMQARGLVERAAGALGVEKADAAAMLDQMGVFEGLDARLKHADTPEKVAQVFRQAERVARESFTIMQADALQAHAQVAFDRVRVEGDGAALDIWVEIEMMRNEEWMNNFIQADEVARKIEMNPEWEGVLWEEHNRNRQDAQRSVNAEYLSRMHGVSEALGLKGDVVVDLFSQEFLKWDEAFSYASEQRKKYFRGDYDNVGMTRGQLEDMINRNFQEAFEFEIKKMQEVGLIFAEGFGKRFGDDAARSYLNRWGDIVDFRVEMWERQRNFRESLVGMDKAEANMAKREFWHGEYLPMVVEMGKLRTDWGGAQGHMRGGGDVPPSSPPTADAGSPRISPDGEYLGGGVETVTKPDYAERVSVARAAEAEAAAARLSAIFDVAEEYTNTISNYDRHVLQDKFALLNALRDDRIGGDPTISGMDDPKVTLEFVRDVMEARTKLVRADIVEAVEKAGGSVDFTPPVSPPNIADTSIQGGAYSRINENTSLLRAIQQHGGIDKNTYALDVTGERNPRTAPGVWMLKGIGLDEMARWLADDGYAIDLDTPDGGMAQLTAMIQDAMRGEKIYPMGHDFDKFHADAQAVWAEDQLAAAQAYEATTSFWDVAAEHGFYGLDDAGQVNPDAAIDLLKLVKRYAGEEGAAVRTVDDLNAEIVNRAFVNQDIYRAHDVSMVSAEDLVNALDDMRARVGRAEKARSASVRQNKILGLRSEIANAIATMPKATPDEVIQSFVMLAEEIDGQYFNVEADRRRAQIEARMQRDFGRMDAEARKIVNRNMVREMLEGLRTEDGATLASSQLDAVMALMDARAEAWSWVTGEDAGRWYETRVAGIEFGIDFDSVKEVEFQTPPRGEGVAPKGAIEFLDDGRAIITAFEKADVSTIVHEVGHIFRRDLMGDDLATVEKWAGVKDGKWERAQEEKFARAFEKYLAEGRAPTRPLARVFEQFKKWMSEIYRVLRGSPLDVSIPEDVRAVFDNLLREPFADEAFSRTVDERLYQSANRTAERGAYLKKNYSLRGLENSFETRMLPGNVDEFVWYGEDGVAEGLLRYEPGQVDIFIPEWVEGREAAVGHLLQAANAYDLTPESLWQIYLESNPNRRGTAGLDIRVDQLARAEDVKGIVEADWFGEIVERGAEERAKFGSPVAESPLSPSGDIPPNALAGDLGGESLYQDADARMPLGGYAQESGWFGEGMFLEDGWTNHVAPLLDAMQDEAVRQLGERPFAFGDLDEGTARDLKRYVNQVKQDMGTAKSATVSYGEGMRDFALLNYNRRYGFDKLFDAWSPYQFFYTRSAVNGLARVLDKPSWFANYARLQMLGQKHENNLPERLRGKIKVPMAWMPEWMGGGMYVDPTNALFQFNNYLQPFERINQDKRYVDIQAERILQEWAEDDTMPMGELEMAFRTHEGATWEKAMAEAARRREYEQAGPLDLVTMMLSPAWYLKNPWYDIPSQIGLGGVYSADTQLPITRAAQAFETVTKDTWAEPVGKFLGLFGKLESGARSATGLDEFGELDVYYTKRQLANMVGEGLLAPDEAVQAMLEQGSTGSPTSEIWEQARERVDLELALRVPLVAPTYALAHEGIGSAISTLPASLFGSGLLPEGELRFRGLNEKWNAAWEKYDAGDTQAIGDFFDDHPEYEAYMAKNKDEGELLRSFLVGQIWDNYMALDKPNKKVVTGQMGNQFRRSFLDSETRSYENIDTDTLAMWAKMLGGQAPAPLPASQGSPQAPLVSPPNIPDGSIQGGGVMVPELEGVPSGVAAEINRYEQWKAESFPGINEILNIYYGTPVEKRREIVAMFPQLKKYWTKRREYLAEHPAAAQFIDRDFAEAIVRGDAEPIGMDSEQARRLLMYYRPSDFAAPLRTADYYLTQATPILNDAVWSYALLGEPLGNGAQMELQFIWEEAGKPTDDLQSFLDEVLVPTLGQ